MRTQRRPPGKPLIRRDAEGGERTAPGWETLSERLIREAQEAGEFDDLPGHGQPLALADETYSGEMALAHHVLRNAAVAPPWIEADKEARRLEGRIEALLDSATQASGLARPRMVEELERLARAHHDAAVRAQSMAPRAWHPRRRLRLADLLARLDAGLASAESRRGDSE